MTEPKVGSAEGLTIAMMIHHTQTTPDSRRAMANAPGRLPNIARVATRHTHITARSRRFVVETAMAARTRSSAPHAQAGIGVAEVE
ncbi:hypothetical protein DMY01_07560 [Cutibacterium avidum]|nr:hypothetical protein DMY01_07560 [Cutibacterium avidum]